MATLDDLADELLLAMARLLHVHDVYRLSTTCRRLYCIAADAQLWRQLFVRDFARLYKDIVDRPLIAACYTVDSWPPEARLLCERTGAVSRMPPPCQRIADLPLPFAHAFAMGKIGSGCTARTQSRSMSVRTVPAPAQWRHVPTPSAWATGSVANESATLWCFTMAGTGGPRNPGRRGHCVVHFVQSRLCTVQHRGIRL
ncbi:F-box incomplete domain containing protein [Pandoravirus celtis]|uniref:F-box incomplete domain containing protein n=1 Tax=Pandoravirus celtis TaxID=2568002 RepID=A0A4D6EIJ5_9VIRU|nr:F-box incomplete domain containing protein [Pandoravirus celtis]